MDARFIKMHGCGNDFVVFDERAGALGLTRGRAAAHSAIQRNLIVALGNGLCVRTPVPPRSKVARAPSARRYVVLQRTKAAAAVFSRKGDDWLTDLLAGDDAILRMPEIGIEIPLSEIYRRVEFEAKTGETGAVPA